MWTRKELKNRAKQALSGNYWHAFLISVVIALAQGSGGSGGGRGGNELRNRAVSDFSPENFLMVSIVAIGLVIFFIAIRIFLGYPLEVGGRKYFVQLAEGRDKSNHFKFAFRNENYSKIILAMLRRGIQNALWFLLLVIPGIIKHYSYSMVPYILADNPQIGSRRAIEISELMTEGHKLDMFVLDLSFIGWYLLGAIAFFVGGLFVLPYYNATYGELYLLLRRKALEKIIVAQRISTLVFD